MRATQLALITPFLPWTAVALLSDLVDTRTSRTRHAAPPFPDGPCSGRVIPVPSDIYSVDVKTSGGSSLLVPPRDISVWVPPGYDDGCSRYPVLYCHDGQNAMLDASSWTGQSWRLTGALCRLYQNEIIPKAPIVVLVDSAHGDLLPGIRRRHLEYSDMPPWCQAHTSFCVNTLKPYVDANFRTLPFVNSTFAIGSSLGAQASLQLLLQYPDVFGGAACLSPAFGPQTLTAVASNGRELLETKKLYFDIGGDINDEKVPFLDPLDHFTEHNPWNPGYFWLDTQLQPSLQALRSSLVDIPHEFLEFPGARHNERAWSQRIHEPLIYLFGDKAG